MNNQTSLNKVNLTLDCIIFGLQKYGGISNYWSQLISYLSQNEQISTSLVIPKDISYKGFKTLQSLSFSLHKEFITPKLSRYLPCPYIRKDNVFHTSYYRIPNTRPKQYVVTVYDFMYERYRHGAARWVHTKQKRHSIERADTILCISEFTKRELVEYLPSIPEDRIHVVPLGIDTSQFFFSPNPNDTDLSNRVLFVGQRGGYKRFDLAVLAVHELPDHVSLGIVGPNLSTDEISMLDKYLTNRWIYYGHATTSRLRQLYSTAYALIFPSDCEGFGLPLLEAMACQCPVVSSHLSSLPEVGGPAALYASEQRADSYAEQLLRLSNTVVRNDTINDGLAQVSKFSWKQSCDKTTSLYSH